MIVQEFLRRIPFTDLMEAVGKSMGKEGETLCSNHYYKEAFDILCNMPPRKKTEDIKFHVSYDDPKDSGKPDLWAEGLDDPEYMEDVVGKKIVMPKNNPFTDAELAAKIFHWATYLGCTPRQQREFLNSKSHRFCTKYSIMAHQLSGKQYLIYPYCKDVKKRMRKAIRNPYKPYGFKKDDDMKWFFYMIIGDRHGRRQNRSKRMRQYRLEKRITWLRKLSERQLLVEDIARMSGECELSVLSPMIMNAKFIMETWRESHTFGKSSRMDYIINLVSNYYPSLDMFPEGGCNACLVVAYTAPGKTLSPQEEATLKALLNENFERKGMDTILLYGEDIILEEDLALRFVGIKYSDCKKNGK